MRRSGNDFLSPVDPEENARRYYELFDPSSRTNRRLDAKIEAERKRSYRQCKNANPTLFRKLKRLSDDELMALTAQYLETQPQTRPDVVALRQEFVFFHLIREAQKPRPVRRYRPRLPIASVPTLEAVPAIVAPVPATVASAALPFEGPLPKPEPEKPKPEEVDDRCYGKAFGINRDPYDVW